MFRQKKDDFAFEEVVSKQKTKLFRLVLFIFVFFALIPFFVFFYLITNYPQKEEITQKENSSWVTALPDKKIVLWFEPNEQEYEVGEKIAVDIFLETNDKDTQGLDILFNYEPNMISLISLDDDSFLDTQDSVFKNFPYFKAQEEEGLIIFSALALPGKSIRGNLKIATIYFKALQSGQTEFNFVFEPGKTDETNVASFGNDILEEVKDLAILIQ